MQRVLGDHGWALTLNLYLSSTQILMKDTQKEEEAAQEREKADTSDQHQESKQYALPLLQTDLYLCLLHVFVFLVLDSIGLCSL